jgi:glycogen(starch) synthase
MVRKKILFDGRHGLLDPFISSAAAHAEVCVLQNAAKEPPALKDVHFTSVRYGTFGLGALFRTLSLETVTPSYIKEYRHILEQVEPDTLICMDFFRLSFLQALRYQRRKPQVRIVMFSETKRWPVGWLTKIVMKVFFWYLKKHISRLDTILVWTRQGESFFQTHLPEAGVCVVPAGVDTELFQISNEDRLRERETLRTICNARYTGYKRHQDLFAAVATLQKRGWEVAVTCIGRADVGKERIERLAAEHGVTELVTFLDPVPQEELVRIYHEHDVLVLPSYNEAIGMVVPEAMACGLPTITSDTVGANVYVKEGETGLVYPTGDVEALARAIERMTDAAKCRQMGAAAAAHIRDHFTVETCSKRFLDAIGV